MDLDDIIASFASLSGDAIGIGLRRPEDETARMVWVNPAFDDFFRCTDAAQWKDKPVSSLNAPEYLEDFIATVKPRFEAEERSFMAETMCQRFDGTRVWTSLNLVSLPRRPDGSRFSIAVYRDLTELSRREERALAAIDERETLLRQARDAQTRLLSAINSMPDPIAIWDREFRLVTCNDAVGPRFLGRSEKLPVGSRIEDIFRDGAHSGRIVDAIGREDDWWVEAVAAIRSGPVRVRTKYSDGRVLRADSHKAPNGDTIVVTLDVTELEHQRIQLEEMNAEVRHLALHDDLTELANRRGFSSAMAALTAQESEAFALLHVDLDHFKAINDTMGHAAGDSVLVETANRLRAVAPSDALVARIGGDEFVVLLVGERAVATAEDLAEQVVAELSKPLEYRCGIVRTGASLGIAKTPISNLDEILGDADIALYKAKSEGRARVAVFDAQDRAAMIAQRTLSDDIIRGIEAGEFVPVFQPQICVELGRAVSAEVLARWHHPERGALQPGEFIKPAEELNVLGRIDQQIFENALAIAREAFRDRPAPGLAFNVGRQRAMSPDLSKALELSKSYRGQVAFELLETIFFDEEADAFLLQIDAIRDCGIEIEIDDFGSGRASVTALQKVSPDRLKIDRQLIKPIVESEESRRLVRSIIEIGSALGIGVIAEGVETESHVRILKEYGCDRMQGYYFSEPQPMDIIYSRFWGAQSNWTQARPNSRRQT